MKPKTIILFLLVCASICHAQTQRPSGINLVSVNYYSTEYIFTDAFKQARTWIPHDAVQSSQWNSGVDIPVSENGYPIEIPYDNGVDRPQIVRGILFTNGNGRYPSGNYRLKVSGSGQIRVWGATTSTTYTAPVDVLVPVDPSEGRVFIEIEESLKENPIHDIKFIFPNYVNNYQTEEFTKEIRDFLSDFQTIRFMNWLKIGYAKNEDWSKRTTKGDVTQSGEFGVAWEYVIDLCNKTQKNAWINIPHRADDNYISELAMLFRDNLDPNLKIYIEYSNETWNTNFIQYRETAAFAQDLGYTGTEWERARKYTAKRSADTFHIFETVFPNTNRLVKVIPGRTGTFANNQLITYFKDPLYNPNQVTADALAIAPYFGNGVANTIGDNGQIDTITISEILDLLEEKLASSFNSMDNNKTLANTNNLELIAYEGGQHLVASKDPYRHNSVLTSKLTAANRHPRMEDMYCQYFNHWYNVAQAGQLTLYSSHQPYGKFGSWGIKEYMDEEHTPKYDAVTKCIFNQNRLSTAPKTKGATAVTVFPNPTPSTLHVNAEEPMQLLEVYTMEGKKLKASNNANSINLESLSAGMYLLKGHGEHTNFNKVIIKK